ncbi:unnamed protein product [Toxocara canis]|uniref:Uncharacterized protein n=1 Tax=Toxocara canis TaxID=6265 RepID=A0A3P7F7I1_TOXCA|nr:unnamed protein product [Toxocara canis]
MARLAEGENMEDDPRMYGMLNASGWCILSQGAFGKLCRMLTIVQWTILSGRGTFRALRHVGCKVLDVASPLWCVRFFELLWLQDGRVRLSIVVDGATRVWTRREVHLGVNVDHLSDPS